MTEAQEIAVHLFDRFKNSGGTPEALGDMCQARTFVKLMTDSMSTVQVDNVAQAITLLALRQPLDRHVRAVQRKMTERAAFGLEKYKTTTERKDVDLIGWLLHLQHELLDGVVYIESALDLLEQKSKS